MRCIYCCFLFLISTILYGQGNDAALWTGVELDKSVAKKVFVHLKFQGRLNHNFSHLDYGFVDIGLTYKFSDHLRIASAYVLNTKNSLIGNNWSVRQQWYGNVRLSYKWDRLSVDNRNQLQTDLEDSQSASGSWFYRNKSVFKFRLNANWKLYGSYEMYFRLGFRPAHESSIYRTRYSAGLDYKISKASSVQFGFLIQNQQKKKMPDTIYAVTIGFNHSLPGRLFAFPKDSRRNKLKFRKI
jgi:hypothetical protein